ncbi:MAG: hypothetical protein AAGA33_12755 [Pseudomonadota bacterium]
MRVSTAATTATAILGIGLASMPVAALAEDRTPLVDPGFEAETAARNGGWQMFGASRYSGDYAHQGNTSMLNGATSKSVPYPPYFVGTVSGSFQEFSAEPGTQWRLTGFGFTPRSLVGTPAFGIVQISFFDDRGRDLGTVETIDSKTAKAKLSAEINNQSPVGEWIGLDTGVATAPEGTATVQAFSIYVDYSGSNTFQGVYFDDLNLECVGDRCQDE